MNTFRVVVFSLASLSVVGIAEPGRNLETYKPMRMTEIYKPGSYVTAPAQVTQLRDNLKLTRDTFGTSGTAIPKALAEYGYAPKNVGGTGATMNRTNPMGSTAPNMRTFDTNITALANLEGNGQTNDAAFGAANRSVFSAVEPFASTLGMPSDKAGTVRDSYVNTFGSKTASKVQGVDQRAVAAEAAQALTIVAEYAPQILESGAAGKSGKPGVEMATKQPLVNPVAVITEALPIVAQMAEATGKDPGESMNKLATMIYENNQAIRTAESGQYARNNGRTSGGFGSNGNGSATAAVSGGAGPKGITGGVGTHSGGANGANAGISRVVPDAANLATLRATNNGLAAAMGWFTNASRLPGLSKVQQSLAVVSRAARQLALASGLTEEQLAKDPSLIDKPIAPSKESPAEQAQKFACDCTGVCPTRGGMASGPFAALGAALKP